MWKRTPPSLTQYAGTAGESLVGQTLAQNTSVNRDQKIVDGLLAAGEPVAFARGHAFVKDEADDNDVYFLISGYAEIILTGGRRAVRRTPTQVGEMAAMEPGQPRSATVKAGKNGVVAWKVDSEAINKIFAEVPDFKARMGEEMRSRHRELTANTGRSKEGGLLFWTVISTLAGLVIGSLMWFGLSLGEVSFLIKTMAATIMGLAGFIVVLRQNPAFFWRSSISMLLLVAIGYIFQRNISLEIDDGSGIRKLSFTTEGAELEPSITIALIIGWIVVFSICSVMEYRRTQTS